MEDVPKAIRYLASADSSFVTGAEFVVDGGLAMGPCGLIDMVGMKTGYDVSQYWGTANHDAQMLKNAAHVKERFLDKGFQGMLGGEGFYKYPNPAYAAPDFLAVPDPATVPTLVDRVMPKEGRRPTCSTESSRR